MSRKNASRLLPCDKNGRKVAVRGILTEDDVSQDMKTHERPMFSTFNGQTTCETRVFVTQMGFRGRFRAEEDGDGWQWAAETSGPRRFGLFSVAYCSGCVCRKGLKPESASQDDFCLFHTNLATLVARMKEDLYILSVATISHRKPLPLVTS